MILLLEGVHGDRNDLEPLLRGSGHTQRIILRRFLQSHWLQVMRFGSGAALKLSAHRRRLRHWSPDFVILSATDHCSKAC